MKSRLYQVGIAGIWVLALLVFVNCGANNVYVEGEANGGGKIQKIDPITQVALGTATFTYHASNCGSPQIPPSGSFNFVDKSPAAVLQYGKNGVMADGTIFSAARCDSPAGCSGEGVEGTCPQGGYLFAFTYRNKNKGVPGASGEGGACVIDNGEGSKVPDDQAAIGFHGGPYDGFKAAGNLSGNAQVGGCP